MRQNLVLLLCFIGFLLPASAIALIDINQVTKEEAQAINTQYLSLYNRINQYDGTQKNLDETELEFVQSTRRYLLETLSSIKQKKEMALGPECHFFDLYLEVLNPALLKQEEWVDLKTYASALRKRCTKANLEKKAERPKEFLESLEADYAAGIAQWVRFVDDSSAIRDGDTIVGVGNTPQLMLESLRLARKNLNLVSVAISKWPGYYKSSVAAADRQESKVGAGLLTPRGIENYRRYLDEIGLRTGAKISEKNRVFFIDNVGEGRGLEFLMIQVLSDFLGHGVKPPDLRIIAFSPIVRKGTQFSGKFVKAEQIPFSKEGVDEVIMQMDMHDAYSSLRFTPNFPAAFWHDWQLNPHERPYYARAFDAQKALMKSLERLGLKVNPHNVIAH